MSEPWRDINDPGFFCKPKPEPADNTRVAYKTDPVPEPKKEPPPTEVKLSEGKFLPPNGGLKFNDKCKVQVKVEYLRETSLKKITFSLFCTYNGKTEAMKPDKEGFEKDGIAEAELELFYPEDYKQGDKADFYFKASHRRGEKVVESEKLTMPIENIIKMRFPLEAKYNDHGYASGERAFGSSRSHGKRAHAGCDLYAPVGEKIYAVADGEITHYRNFYGQTYALEIDHGTYIVRYGEVQPPKSKHGYENDIPPENVRNGLPDSLIEGDSIKKGQHIAFVGQLRLDKDKNGKLHNYPHCMLHFELYNKDSNGSLTVTTPVKYKHVLQKSYQRRNDLLDPTKSLEQAEKE